MSEVFFLFRNVLVHSEAYHKIRKILPLPSIDWKMEEPQGLCGTCAMIILGTTLFFEGSQNKRRLESLQSCNHQERREVHEDLFIFFIQNTKCEITHTKKNLE